MFLFYNNDNAYLFKLDFIQVDEQADSMHLHRSNRGILGIL